MKEILEKSAKFFTSIKGMVISLAAVLGAIIAFLKEPQLTLLLVVGFLELAGAAFLFIIWRATAPAVLMEIYPPKYPIKRWIGSVLFVAVLALDAWFLTSPTGRDFLGTAFQGFPKSAQMGSDPAFEINFIGLPYEDDPSYYVTDAMVRTKGDLSAYTDFTLTPLQVEVTPNYEGDEKLANIVLRLGGDSGATKDIKLWDDFDDKPKTATLPLSDIISISGIHETRQDLNTNLGLKSKPYPLANLRLQVVRLSNTSSILSEKTLAIKNTPWIQTAKIVNRDGFRIDYALENLGPRAKFYCHMLIARTKSDVTSSDHSFWSGVDFAKGMNCESFSLLGGETTTQSLSINNETMAGDFPHGRYIVEIYTFAERADVTFNNGLNYETSGQSWVFANTGSILTFVLCNDPGKTCEETDTLAIEEEMVRAFPFDSKSEVGNGETDFAVKTYPLGNRSVNWYYLDYRLDPEKEGWAGFGISFENLVDVSDFDRIRFKLTLDQSSDVIWLDVRSKSDDNFKTARVFVGDGTYGTPVTDEQVINVPLSAFSGVDWSTVDSLYFGLDSAHVPDTEIHTLQIGEIEFIR